MWRQTTRISELQRYAQPGDRMTKIKKMLTALAAATVIQAGAAHAEYPDQRINIIVPFVAGGATDIIARTIAADLASPPYPPSVPCGRCR